MYKRSVGIVLLLACCIFSVSCATRGNGIISSTDFSLQDFASVEVFGSAEIRIYYAKTQSVRLTTDENLKEFVILEVNNDVLMVSSERGKKIRFTKYLVEIYTDDLESISCHGSSNVQVFDKINGFQTLSVAGSATIQFNESVVLGNLDGKISGSGKITAKGKCNNLNISIAGSGKFLGAELEAENADVKVSGSGTATVFAVKILNANIGGSGKIFYKGNPTVNEHIGGSGMIKRI
ncbi:MAG: head GIN domain-containing protein [Termitinemataceae bacterium]|nr:MAG: head GIN domain-containing protein [Termitinemataceae bacterium]